MLEQVREQWRFIAVGIALVALAIGALAAGVAVLAQGQGEPVTRQPVAAQTAAPTVEAPMAAPAAQTSGAAAQPTPRPPQGATYHTVQSGETLGKIATAYGVTTAAIASANGISNPNMIYVGQKILIPAR